MILRDAAELDRLYGAPVESSVVKVADHVTPQYRA